MAEEQETPVVRREPAKMYAFVRQGRQKGYVDSAYGIYACDSTIGNEPGWNMANWEDEPPYEDCDYDNLSGLLVFEGDLVRKLPAFDELSEDEQQNVEDNEGCSFHEHESCYVGSWRRITAAEAGMLGVLNA